MESFGRQSGISQVERSWLAVTTSLTAWSLLAVGLARAGLYRTSTLAAALLLAAVLACASFRFLPRHRPAALSRERLIVALLLVLGAVLFGWPAEHFALFGDSAIYSNTAALLQRSGGLTAHYAPFDGLTGNQKVLFYLPADQQLSNVQFKSYEGLLYGAYYVVDADSGSVVASRPPLASVWMGLFDGKAMLYVTPVFGALSLVVVYLLGMRLWNTGAGVLAATWLAVSFPQLYFSRAPYAEVIGQFFVLSALYVLILYSQTHSRWLCLLGAALLAASFAARIDSILALPAVGLFLLLIWVRRDWRGLTMAIGSLLGCLGFALWTANRPYTGATAEILLSGYLRSMRQLGLAPIVLVGLVLATLLALAVYLWHRFPRRSSLLVGRGLTILILLAVAYSLYLRPLSPEYFSSNGSAMRIYGEEVMAAPARYIGHLIFWLAVAGIATLLWKSMAHPEHWLFLIFLLSFAAVFFWRYTTGWIYPVALRRLVPEVFPGMMLLAAFAVLWLAQRLKRRLAGTVLAGLVFVLLLRVSAPYWFLQEGRGTWQFFTELAQRLPQDAVVLFEPLRGDSVVGWFAAPLWSFYERDALLLNQGPLDQAALQGALCLWQAQGREVLVLAQEDPSAWWPGPFQGTLLDKLHWGSTLIGQSRQFPPFVWRFAFTFYLYQVPALQCSS